MSKVELRKDIKQTILGMDWSYRRHADEAICSTLTEILERLVSANVSLEIGVYCPLKDEVCWFSTKSFDHWNLSIPSDYQTGSMVYRRCDWTNMGPELSVKAGVTIPEVLLIPALGFTRDGFRLGRGGGHYDRYLENYKGKTIGLCYEIALIEKLPIESHDVAINLVITEKNILGDLNRFLIKKGE